MRLSPNAVPRECVSDEKDDRVIRERQFKIGANLDIEDLGIGKKSEEVDYSNLSDSEGNEAEEVDEACLLYTSPSPRDGLLSRMPSSA